MITGHGVINIPPRDFMQPSRWDYRVHEGVMSEIGAVAYDITSTRNFMNVRSAILEELNSSKRILVVKILG
jgi:hypothetical protein